MRRKEGQREFVLNQGQSLKIRDSWDHLGRFTYKCLKLGRPSLVFLGYTAVNYLGY